METNTMLPGIERLEQKLENLKETMDINHNAQQDFLKTQDRETKRTLQLLYDQQQLIQGQLSDITDSLSLFRERYQIQIPPRTVRSNGVNRRYDDDKTPTEKDINGNDDAADEMATGKDIHDNMDAIFEMATGKDINDNIDATDEMATGKDTNDNIDATDEMATGKDTNDNIDATGEMATGKDINDNIDATDEMATGKDTNDNIDATDEMATGKDINDNIDATDEMATGKDTNDNIDATDEMATGKDTNDNIDATDEMATGKDTNDNIDATDEMATGKDNNDNIDATDEMATGKDINDNIDATDDDALSPARQRRKSWAGSNIRGSTLSSGSEDERIRNMKVHTTCMANAIKRNFVSIVETLPFKESEIPDSVIETCVNESECEYIRGLADRRDQVRTLVTMVIKRNREAMESFLEIVSQHDTASHKNIQDTFKELLEERYGLKTYCTLCTLVKKVDILKDVCDHICERFMLSDDLYSEITRSHPSEELWRKMLDEALSSQSPYVVMYVIIGALKRHGTFHGNIVRMLERDIQRHRKLKCRCYTP